MRWFGLLRAAVLLGAGFTASTLQAAGLGLWDCVERAVNAHPLAAAGAWRVAEADGAAEESRVPLLPQFGFSGNYSVGSYVPEVSFPGRSMKIGDHDDLTLSVQADYLLCDWGRRRAALEADRRQLEAAGCGLGAVRQDLAYRAGAAFLTLLGASSQRRVAEVSVSTAGAHLEDLQALHAVGRLTWDEVLNGEVRLDEARVRLSRAGYQVELARAELCQSLGLEPGAAVEFADTAEDVPQAPAAGEALSEVLTARPDFARYAVQAAALELRSAAIGAEDKPTVQLFVTGTAAQPGADQFRNEFIQYARAGVAVNWQFWDWHRKDYRLARNEAARQSLLAEGRDLHGRIALELERSRLQEREAADRLALTDKTLTAAAEHFRLLGERFDQGRATNTEYLDSEAQLTASRLDRAQAWIELELARWRRAYVSGRLSREIESRWPQAELQTAAGRSETQVSDQPAGEEK